MAFDIGGLIPLEYGEASISNSLPWQHADSVSMMSGRCAITHVLKDILAEKKTSAVPLTAYFPAYTCETVLAPFQKLGFRIRYYSVDRQLVPHFRSSELCADVLLLTGYYGFPSYEQATLDGQKIHSIDKLIHEAGKNKTKIIFDLTHSFFNTPPLPEAWDYAVVSFRKWIGIAAGGLALKKASPFNLLPLAVDEGHLQERRLALSLARKLQSTEAPAERKALQAEINKIFWSAEFALRKSFDNNAGDSESESILRHYNFQKMKEIRRKNYSLLSSLLPETKKLHGTPVWQIIFPELSQDVCPSHFSLLSKFRDQLKTDLESIGVHTKFFWPTLPTLPTTIKEEAEKITRDVISLPIDQLCSEDSMRKLADILNNWQPSRV